MTDLRNEPVIITTFANPHLFYVLKQADIPKRKSLEEALTSLRKHFVYNAPKLRSVALVNDQGTWKRARIDVIKNGFTCFLIDHGTPFNAKEVYILPQNYRQNPPPFAKHAALKNTTCLHEKTTAFGFEKIENYNFSAGAVKVSKRYIDNAKNIYCNCVEVVSDVLICDLTIEDSDRRRYDLANALVSDGVLAINEKLFRNSIKRITEMNQWTFLDMLGDASVSSNTESCETLNGVKDIVDLRGVGRGISYTSNSNKNKSPQKPSQETSNSPASVEPESLMALYKRAFESSSRCEPSTSQVNEAPKTIGWSSGKETLSHLNIPPPSSYMAMKKEAKAEQPLENTRKERNKQIPTKGLQNKESTVTDTASSTSKEKFNKDLQLKKSVAAVKKEAKADQPLENTRKERNKQIPTKGLQNKESTVADTASSTSKEKFNKDLQLKKSVAADKCSSAPSCNLNDKKNNLGVLPKLKLYEVGCKCQKCQNWTKDLLYEPSTETAFDATQKKNKVCIRPPLLLKCEPDEEEPTEIKAAFPAFQSNVERAIMPKIVVHGTSIAPPISSVLAVPFSKCIHEALRSFQQVYSIQSYVWPSLMRRMSVFLINTPNSGKTMAYLPPICTYLLEKGERYPDLPQKTISPIAIILCPGIKSAEEVYRKVSKLLSHSSNSTSVILVLPPLNNECLSQFRKPFDLLIATPMSLVSLLHAKIITTKRVCHFIIDNADVIMDKFHKELNILLALLQNMLEHRVCCYPIQMVVVSEHWTSQLERLMKSLNITPVVCIGSFLEAALYGRADLKMHFLESQHKKATLTDLVKEEIGTSRTLILCNTDSEIEDVKEYLQLAGISAYYLYNSTNKDEIIEAETRWISSIGNKHSALVCTDLVYNHTLSVRNAVLLIHYTLPKTWTQFTNRFSCFLDNYESPMNAQKNLLPCKVHIFIDEDSRMQFPKMVQLLQRFGSRLSTKFQQYYTALLAEQENNKISAETPLCPNIKLFGECTNIKCHHRHKISEKLDYSYPFPKNGVINFKITRIVNVTTFTIKLLEYTDCDGNKHTYDSYENLDQELEAAMAESTISVVNVNVGDVVAYYSSENKAYYRCRVTQIIKQEKMIKRAAVVGIKLLDNGMEKEVGRNCLYKLPTELKNIPPQALTVYLANMVPPEFDDCWSFRTMQTVKELFDASEYTKDSAYVTGKVLLQLGDTFWLEKIIVMEHIKHMKVNVVKLNLRKTLKEMNLVGTNEKQLGNLYKLCKEASIQLPSYELTSKKSTSKISERRIEPQWAFFQDSHYNEIYIICIHTPSLFYVRIKKFYDLLLNLENDINKSIKKPHHPTVVNVNLNNYYAAKDSQGDNYCRVKIVELMEDDMVKCFYVDYGDYEIVSKCELKYLNEELISKLPFQAIECRLYGVRSVNEDWTEYAIDTLWEYVYQKDTNYFRTLYVTPLLSESAKETNKKYAILLVDVLNNKVMTVNKLFIDCGEGLHVEDENLDQEFEIYKTITGDDDTNDPIYKQIIENDIEGWDVCINDTEAFLSDVFGMKPGTAIEGSVDKPQAQSSRTLTETAVKPSVSPSSTRETHSNTNHRLPNINWSQTLTDIKIKILLPHLKDYDFKVIRNSLVNFSAIYNGNEYRSSFHLFNAVQKTYRRSDCGLYTELTLTKCQPLVWDRLIRSTTRMRNITYDMSQPILIDNIDDDDDKLKKPILSFDKSLGGDEILTDGMIVEYGSDEYSDSCSDCDSDAAD